jgi:hypothetical protein
MAAFRRCVAVRPQAGEGPKSRSMQASVRTAGARKKRLDFIAIELQTHAALPLAWSEQRRVLGFA